MRLPWKIILFSRRAAMVEQVPIGRKPGSSGLPALARRALGILNSRRENSSPGHLLVPLVFVTDRCNLRCRFCDLWKTPESCKDRELRTGDYLTLMRELKELGAVIVSVSGGEPLLRPDIFEIMHEIKRQNMVSHICTNGTLLTRDAVRGFREAHLDTISISLDSWEPSMHNFLRGGAVFERVKESITLLREEIPRLRVRINYLVCKANFRNLSKMLAFAEELGVESVKFMPLHTNLQHRSKSRESFEELLFHEKDIPELMREIGELIKSGRKTSTLGNPLPFLERFPLSFGGKRDLPCFAGFVSCSINPYGFLSPCPEFDSSLNIRDSSPASIWSSAEFRALRSQVLSCTRSCWDTTNGELSLKLAPSMIFRDPLQFLRDLRFYHLASPGEGRP